MEKDAELNFNVADEISTHAAEVVMKEESKCGKTVVANTVFIWFDELKIINTGVIRRLPHYDLRVYTAIGNLYLAGNRQVTVNDIYRTMGNPNQKNASQDQRAKIFESIEKMSSIRITIDNGEELKAGFKYPPSNILRKYLLCAEFTIINKCGNLTEAIEIRSMPCLFEYAIKRGQYTTIPTAIFNTPLNQTEHTLAIENYLLRRISMGNGNSCTILFSTLYENVEANTPNKRKSTREKVERILEYWKKQGHIKRYKLAENGSKSKNRRNG